MASGLRRPRHTPRLLDEGTTRAGLHASPARVRVTERSEIANSGAFPDLRFSVGSMTALEIEDDTLGGILAHYSTHHTPPELLPVVFAEFHRTLAPGGHLLLAGHVGTGEHRRPAHGYGGHPVSYTSYRLPTHQLAELLNQAGFTITAQMVQEPDEKLHWKFASFLAYKAGYRGASLTS